ncbi:unnamed protein product [Microthlaspi erraticum]|uniref:Uncharacterized protein n=1 Tax=Microthlaspi erraticum TaxID=1685480 RepID=A0A6D2JCH8_9BRAS|nr:unnamed protein product [Microthlaspi erraticum]
MEKEPQAFPIKAMPIRHIPPQRPLGEQEMSSPQAPPPSWDSPPRPSLEDKEETSSYLEAADLETSSQAASHQRRTPSSHTRRGD